MFAHYAPTGRNLNEPKAINMWPIRGKSECFKDLDNASFKYQCVICAIWHNALT
jgi:hypothetical protein